MSVAGRFAAKFYRLQDATGDEPELLGNRLATAGAYAVSAAGGGISVFTDIGLRLPVGASSDPAVLAERLQFTTGQGPCLHAQHTGRMVRADQAALIRQWPDFHRTLVDRTPFRAVLAVPVIEDGAEPVASPVWGCVDLFFRTDADMTATAAADASVVSALVGSLLSVSASNDGPAWLHGPVAVPRQATMSALGLVSAARQLDTGQALEVLRAHARHVGSTVDRVSGDLMERRLLIGHLQG